MFLVDTNVVPELRKTSRCHPRAAAWQSEECFLSVVSLLEIRLGIELVRRMDPRQAGLLSEWLERRVKAGFAGRIVPVDEADAERCGLPHAERPRSFRDGVIPATAAVRGLAVVTRNTKDFAGGGVEVLNPWK